ncbi:high mobility group B protein 3-like [Macadamia integrifolia]|uniref:high mobility group B protein 3-like n=1 Tax=Macadamia integrifolia TaxID=60698 RepID=UPI001C530B18|nr:high mobility group B protein 3-like [Macadamia integrifolia]
MRRPAITSISHKKPEAQSRVAKKLNTDPNVKKDKSRKKDPDAPKRPAGAFFVFMEEFRKMYKENFPDNKSVSAVGKAGGEKWKSMSDSEKAPYVAKADKRKADYEKALKSYNQKANGAGDGAKDDDSDRSTSEVHNGEIGENEP